MTTRPPVTVLGLGPMGQAMTQTLLAAGHSVTVWNRTPSCADAVVAAGARLAPDQVEAVRASDLVLVSLTDYRAMWDVLGDAGPALAGRTLANLSSDTPETTREAAEWASSHGATFLAGGMMVPPPLLGTDLASSYVAGDRAGFEAHRETLARISAPRPDWTPRSLRRSRTCSLARSRPATGATAGPG